MSFAAIPAALLGSLLDIVGAGFAASVSDYICPPANKEKSAIRIYLDGVVHTTLLLLLAMEFSNGMRALLSYLGIRPGSTYRTALAGCLPLLLSGHAVQKLKKIQRHVTKAVGGITDPGVSPSGNVTLKRQAK